MTRELSGPPTFDDWRRSWRVYRFSFVVLGAASTARLDRYFERVQQLYADYGSLGGQNLWWVVCLADVRMRSERFERLRRALDDELESLTKLGRAAEARIDVRRPWDSVFLAAAEDDAWRDGAVKEKAIL